MNVELATAEAGLSMDCQVSFRLACGLDRQFGGTKVETPNFKPQCVVGWRQHLGERQQMFADLNASALNVGALFPATRFTVPIYQREYAWTLSEVKDFWSDLQAALSSGDSTESYFLGLLILTDEHGRQQVVDGQQRILTLTLLIAALRNQAKAAGRAALADKLQSDFLYAVNYESDELEPRIKLSGDVDNLTLNSILQGKSPDAANDFFSMRIREAFDFLSTSLSNDVRPDPFKRLGGWAEFISSRLFFAVFVHPDPASAYRVFEAINTRGAGLTTADLLKNFVLSQVPRGQQASVYERWKGIADQFSHDGGTSFVQYIRHVVTPKSGYVLPRDLFDYLARRGRYSMAAGMAPMELVTSLEEKLPLYSQMIDPEVGGPADEGLLPIFGALNQISVITVRPLMISISELTDSVGPANELLKLVVRRIVVGNLGTGNIERRFSEAAKRLRETSDWNSVYADLSDLNPRREEFEAQIWRRSFNKSVLAFLRRSIIQRTTTPTQDGALHLIRIRNAPGWGGFNEEELSYWINTLGNTFLSTAERRPADANTWTGFKARLLPFAAEGEEQDLLKDEVAWNANSVGRFGEALANAAGDVWYA